jgi:hypothetical protein
LASRRLRRTKSFSSYLASLNQDIETVKYSAINPAISSLSIDAENLVGRLILNEQSVESYSYQEGLSGWKISSSGVAEFSNVFVRGDINASSGTIGYWNISSPEVTRRIGDRLLYGTFLESEDIGAIDNGKTSGTYVGLFKSYVDVPVPITAAYRTDNVAIVYAPSHQYNVGDFVYVSIADNFALSTGNLPVEVIEIGYGYFKYLNKGNNISINSTTITYDGEGVPTVTDIVYTGYSVLATADTAGIYLQDYGKRIFDYGYFSNDGVAYASAKTYNLVLNPSLEYVNSSGNTVSSTSGWTNGNTSSIVTFQAVQFANVSSSVYGLYENNSEYGLEIGWTSIPANSTFSVEVNYSLIDSLVSTDPTMYLHFDVFSAPFHQAPSVLVDSYVENVISNVSVITVTTNTAHGLTANDYIYETIFGSAGSSTPEESFPGGDSAVVQVSSVVSNTVFRITNTFNRASGETQNYIGTADRDQVRVAKLNIPEFNAKTISLNFGNSSALVPIDDVATPEWALLSDTYKYLSLTNTELNASIVNDYQDARIECSKLPSLGSVDRASSIPTRFNAEITISLAKLYAKYKEANPTGLANGSNFKIVFPGKITSFQVGGTTHANLSSGSLVFDNVSLSTEKRFFFADSGSSAYSWYDDDSKPGTPSVQSTKKWIDINLDTQTANYKYTDLIEFKSPSFSGDLDSNPGIFSTALVETEQVVWQELHQDSTASYFFSSSGSYVRPSNIATGDYPNYDASLQSYSVAVLNSNHTSYQISSDIAYYNSSGAHVGTQSASLALDSYEDTATNRGSQAWLSADNIIFSNRNNRSLEVDLYGNMTITGKFTSSGTKVILPQPTLDNSLGDPAAEFLTYAATTKYVKDSQQVYYLASGLTSDKSAPKKIYVSNTTPSSGTTGDIWIQI